MVGRRNRRRRHALPVASLFVVTVFLVLLPKRGEVLSGTLPRSTQMTHTILVVGATTCTKAGLPSDDGVRRSAWRR